MLQLNFENSIHNKTNSHIHSHEPKLKTDYAAGFRKYQERKNEDTILRSTSNKSQYHIPQSLGKQVIGYVSQLGIQNLAHFYYQAIKDEDKPDLKQIKQQQDQSVTRLYKNLYPKKKTKQNQQTEQEEEDRNKKCADDVWVLDKKYETQPIQYIVNKEIEKTHKKFIVELQGLCKRKKIEPALNFKFVFACFLIEQLDNIEKVIRRQLSREEKELQIFYLWKSFLSTAKPTLLEKKYISKSINKQNLTKLKNSCPYLYCIIAPITQTQILNLEDIKNAIIEEIKISSQEIIQKFSINKEYTNPYCIQYNPKTKPNKNYDQQQIKQQEPPIKIKANPIPKSLYEKPKQFIRPEPKTTEIKQFNLTQQKRTMSPEQYYHWERGFKAKPVPKTTYKAQKPALMSEEQKKAKALLSLQKAKYPSTMKNLNHLNQEKQNKMEELAKKYQKVRQRESSSPMPNFEYLHAQELILFETLKQKNKKEIKVQPFNLSVGKSRPVPQVNNFIVPSERHTYQPTQKPVKLSKSTKKFDAYVNFRKNYESNKAKVLEEKEKNKDEENQKKKPLVDIIKNRMYDELNAHPKKRNPYDQSMPTKIEVDKEKIYRERPLLMQSTLPRQEYNLPWDPIF